MKKVLITGITGQDGAYMSRLLLEKGYEVHGMIRRASTTNLHNIKKVMYGTPFSHEQINYHYGDLTDSSSIARIISKLEPDEIYNLGAMSDVHASFDIPAYTVEVNTVGFLSILEAVRSLLPKKSIKVYQACTSEMYGNKEEGEVLNEDANFRPCSPYGVSKVAAYWLADTYRKAYGIYVSNGILFNHESIIRGEQFVTQKIAKGLAEILNGKRHYLELGNLNAVRDWGHAQDYVESIWRMLQKDKPGDYVICTGEGHSIRDFIEESFRHFGVEIECEGTGVDEVVKIKSLPSDMKSALRVGQVVVKVSPDLFRPVDINKLKGSAEKAKSELNWTPKYTFGEIVSEMIQNQVEMNCD